MADGCERRSGWHFRCSQLDGRNSRGSAVPGGGAFAGNNPNKAAGSTWYKATTSTLEHGSHVHRNSKNGMRFNRKGQPVDGGERPIKGAKPIDKRLLKDFQKVFDRLNPQNLAIWQPQVKKLLLKRVRVLIWRGQQAW